MEDKQSTKERKQQRQGKNTSTAPSTDPKAEKVFKPKQKDAIPEVAPTQQKDLNKEQKQPEKAEEAKNVQETPQTQSQAPQKVYKAKERPQTALVPVEGEAQVTAKVNTPRAPQTQQQLVYRKKGETTTENVTPIYQVKGSNPGGDKLNQRRPMTSRVSNDEQNQDSNLRKVKKQDASENVEQNENQRRRRQNSQKQEGKNEVENQDNSEQVQGNKNKNYQNDLPKNLVYQNPFDFKESHKFKSKQEEYHYGEWRRGSGKTFVTLETVIPAIPEKLLPQPDEAGFQKKLREIDDKVKEITKQLEEKKSQFDEILHEKIATQKAGDSGLGYSKEIGQKLQRLSELKQKKAKIYEQQEIITKEKPDLERKRDVFLKNIDSVYNQEDMVPKAIKMLTKKLETTTLNNKQEKEIIKQINMLKNSIEYIQKRDIIQQKINEMMTAKKKAGLGLAQIFEEIKTIQAELDDLKKNAEQKQETKESFDKQLDRINEKRKKERDERDKLYKQKDEIKEKYYTELILFSKQEFLLKDIKWMNETQSKLRERQQEKDRREQEQKERKEKIEKEREERRLKEEERKQKEIEKKQREEDNKKLIEEQMQKREVDQLQKIQASIDDTSVASNSFYEQINLCEQLKKYCLKKHDSIKGEKGQEEKAEEAKKNAPKSNDLAKLLEKGSLVLAPSKQERDTKTVLEDLAKNNKNKKSKKGVNETPKEFVQVDFGMIKKFTELKLSVPSSLEDYEKTLGELDDLRDALIYWGKIIQRQNKIKFIRGTNKLKLIAEYETMVNDELAYIANEKQKFQSEEESERFTGVNFQMLQVAQQIDKDRRAKQSWANDDDDEEEENFVNDDDPNEVVYRIDDLGDEDDPRTDITKLADKKKKTTGPKQASRIPKQEKFKEIMQGDQAFPTLDNAQEDEEFSDDETPEGEIESNHV